MVGTLQYMPAVKTESTAKSEPETTDPLNLFREPREAFRSVPLLHTGGILLETVKRIRVGCAHRKSGTREDV